MASNPLSEFPDARPARVGAVTPLSADIIGIDLWPDGWFEAAPAGSHIRLKLEIEGRTQFRHYSIIEAGPDFGYRIAVRHLADGRGGSARMCALKAGERLTISPPRQAFPLTAGRPGYLLIAGGIGITPLIAMARQLALAGAGLQLHHAVRRRSDLVFADDLRQLLGARMRAHISDEGQRLDLGAAIDQLHKDGELYLCGPRRLLDEARKLWLAAGRDESRLRYESFGNDGVTTNQPFRIRVPRLGVEVDVAANQSALDALEAAGVDLLSDCRRGECGLCAVPVLDSEQRVDHRDIFFSDRQKSENSQICLCVSRAEGGVVTIDSWDR